jgi:RsiW-degrading membrane proteinase PrsW (M82 family)
MSIVALIVIVFLVALGAWITSQANWPEPFKWAAWAALFLIVVVLILRSAGISLGSI